MPIATLFITARRQKQPKCPADDKFDSEKMIHMHSGILFNYKKSEIMKFKGKWMELEIIMPRKVAQT